jgi:hypothetical protein
VLRPGRNDHHDRHCNPKRGQQPRFPHRVRSREHRVGLCTQVPRARHRHRRPEGATCVKGAGGGCTCPPGQTACGGRCVDLNTDVSNCGACGTQCGQGGQPPCCVQGRCVGFAQAVPSQGDLCVCAAGGDGCQPLPGTVCCDDNICRETCPS